MLRSFTPLFDRVLVERFAPELKTKGGIMLPEKSQGKVLEATVVAAGPGARNEKGDVVPMAVKVKKFVLIFFLVFIAVRRKGVVYASKEYLPSVFSFIFDFLSGA